MHILRIKQLVVPMTMIRSAIDNNDEPIGVWRGNQRKMAVGINREIWKRKIGEHQRYYQRRSECAEWSMIEISTGSKLCPNARKYSIRILVDSAAWTPTDAAMKVIWCEDRERFSPNDRKKIEIPDWWADDAAAASYEEEQNIDVVHVVMDVIPDWNRNDAVQSVELKCFDCVLTVDWYETKT